MKMESTTQTTSQTSSKWKKKLIVALVVIIILVVLFFILKSQFEDFTKNLNPFNWFKQEDTHDYDEL